MDYYLLYVRAVFLKDDFNEILYEAFTTGLRPFRAPGTFYGSSITANCNSAYRHRRLIVLDSIAWNFRDNPQRTREFYRTTRPLINAFSTKRANKRPFVILTELSLVALTDLDNAIIQKNVVGTPKQPSRFSRCFLDVSKFRLIFG